MTHSRRSVLRTASALSALAIGASSTASAADCSGVPAWDATTLYETGEQVQHPDGDGVDALWEAALDSRNAEPSRSNAYWDYVDDCDGGGGGNEAPTASFTTDVSTPEPGQDVTFDASGSGDPDGVISSYDWAFGDGSSASGETAAHSYDSSGDYTVTLTVTDDAGATDTDSTTVSVSDGGDDNQTPDASFTVSPSSPEPGESATFDAADSSDVDGSITSYDWEFGDDSSASGQTASHSYGSEGDYTVTLTVTDDDGATDSNATTVVVGADGGGGGGGGGEDCSGVPEWNAGATYTEGDQVTDDGSLWTANWWTQGDEPGADGEWGPWDEVGACSGGSDLTASIVTDGTFVAPGDAVEFDGSGSSDSIQSYEWDLDGDGTVDATGEVVTHTYEATGEHDVTLTVTDGEGHTDEATVTITVEEGGGGGAFPENVFAPYVDVLLDEQEPLVDSVGLAGTRHFVLAFVVADGDGDPAWGGTQTVGEPSEWLDVGAQIDDLRQQEGGDVIVSFGGLQGTYLPETTTSAEALKDKYAQVVETYDVSFLDFDEEKLIRDDHEKVALRNEALVLLKEEYPDLRISYTLPVLPSGFPTHSSNDVLFALEDAADRGLDVDLVNPMTMNYGSDFELNGDTVIEAAQSVHAQLGDLWPETSAAERWQMIGLTPMIGQNDVDSNVFYQEDARQVRDWASQQNLRMLSFWELVRDDGEGDQLYNDSRIEQEPYEFSGIFDEFDSE